VHTHLLTDRHSGVAYVRSTALLLLLNTTVVAAQHTRRLYRHSYCYITIQQQLLVIVTAYRTAGAAASRKAPTAVPTVKRRVTRFGAAPLVVDCPGVITRPFSSVTAAVGTGVSASVGEVVGTAVSGAAVGTSVKWRTLL
jgi:hypothetical protein